MSDLVEFLQARLAEDEQVAKATKLDGVDFWAQRDDWMQLSAPAVAHAHRHDPARTLAEVEGKRRIVADLLAEPHFLNDSEWYGCRAVAEGPGEDDVPTGRECTCGRDARVELYLRLLALPYADHADYREEWRP